MHVKVDNKTLRITGAPGSVIRALQEQTSFRVEGCEHAPSYRAGHWDGKERLVSAVPREGGGGHVAPIGLYADMVAVAEAQGVAIRWQDARRPLHPRIAVSWNEAWSLRPYQQEAVDAILADRGLATGKVLLRLATRGGKTRIAARIIHQLGLRSIFLVSSDILLKQAHAAFTEGLGVPIGQVGGGVWDERDITVVSLQTLSRQMEDMTMRLRRHKKMARDSSLSIGKYDTEELLDLAIKTAQSKLVACLYSAKYKKVQKDGKWTISEPVLASIPERVERERAKAAAGLAMLSKYDVVFFDECHHLEAEQWRKTLDAMDARYKIGLSATILMEDPDEGYPTSAIWLRASTGPIVYDVDVSDLIEAGYLVRPTVRLVAVRGPKVRGAWVVAKNKGIIHHEHRNRLIVLEAARAVNRSLRVLVIVRELSHVKLLVTALSSAGLRAEAIIGATSPKKRQDIIARFARGDVQVIVGTVFGEGVDIPAIECVINAEGGASRIDGLQRMRQLTPAPGKTIAEMVDFMDLHNPYLSAHSLARLRLYRQQRAFVIQAVEP